jgi:hypothetical protein
LPGLQASSISSDIVLGSEFNFVCRVDEDPKPSNEKNTTHYFVGR